MWLEELRLLPESFPEAPHDGRPGSRLRRLRRILPVDEYDPRPLSPRERAGVRAFLEPRLLARRPERHLRDRPDVRILPLLVLHARKTERRKTREGFPSD